MALTPTEQIRLLVGDTLNSPFYPQLTDEQIQGLLDMSNGSVFAAAKLAAISIAMNIAGYNTREIAGDIHVYNEYSRNYLKALEFLITNPGALIPNGLMPWTANKGCPSKLLTIEVCDDEPCVCPTGCNPNGKTF